MYVNMLLEGACLFPFFSLPLSVYFLCWGDIEAAWYASHYLASYSSLEMMMMMSVEQLVE
jgi:hypothetical protein